MPFIRNKTVDQVLQKYPTKVPIHITKKEGSAINELEKKKYLVSKDFTMGQFVATIRKYLRLEPSDAIFLFIDNMLVNCTVSADDLYNSKKSPDGILYIKYASEEVFG